MKNTVWELDSLMDIQTGDWLPYEDFSALSCWPEETVTVLGR